ncbi:hypothetical protein BGX27_000409 [Mortierella sp. AM989]|nr:hypothetical protein BGX27_000409 [Mortierella sp. AM989]
MPLLSSSLSRYCPYSTRSATKFVETPMVSLPPQEKRLRLNRNQFDHAKNLLRHHPNECPVTFTEGISLKEFSKYIDTHPKLPVRICLTEGSVVAYEYPQDCHAYVTGRITGLLYLWDATHDLRIGGNLDVVVGSNSMLIADCFIRPKRRPHPPPGQGTNDAGLAYPTVVTEIATSQSLRSVTAKVPQYFSARTTIQAFLVIKIWEPRQDGTMAMVALLYRRANPNPMIPISTVSFGTAGIDPQANQGLVGIVGDPNLITGVGYGGAACDGAGIPAYQLNIPAVDIYNGDPQGIPAARIHGFNLDLWDIQMLALETNELLA